MYAETLFAELDAIGHAGHFVATGRHPEVPLSYGVRKDRRQHLDGIVRRERLGFNMHVEALARLDKVTSPPASAGGTG